VVDRIPLGAVPAAGITGPIVPFGLAIDGSALWVSDFLVRDVGWVDPLHGRGC
jgi:hypothetical protein